MKYKKALLIIFFLTFFVFQQAQADKGIPTTKKPLQGHFAPAYAPYERINVYVLYLDPNTNKIYKDAPRKCIVPNEFHGCGIIDPEQPNSPRNPVPITVDPYYLRDVITIEMNVGEIPPTPQELSALKAQAIAARTVASWKAKNQHYDYYGDGEGYINNSTQYQVFIPGSYNDYPSAQSLISQAVSETQGQYLSYGGGGLTIDAEFGSDMLLATQTEHLNPGDPPVDPFVPKDYLKGVQDPISTAYCFNNSSGGHDYGMSQRGAIRWALGNQCPTGNGTAWPVKWSDYRQILVHYYTGVDILDAGGYKKAPDDRWNLLNHDVPSNMLKGDTPTVKFTLQNTSTTAWTDAILGWEWVPSCGAVNRTDWQWDHNQIPMNVNPGDTIEQTVTITTPPNDGAYILHVDVKRMDGGWFQFRAPAGWPDAEIPIQIGSIPDPAGAPAGFFPYGITGCYYNDLSALYTLGAPINWGTFTYFVTAIPDQKIDFNTHSRSPIPGTGVNGIFWSARWIGTLNVTVEGDYTFSLENLDDGGRLWVDHIADDDPPIVESWLVQGPTTYSSQQPYHLTVGPHDFRVDYVQGPVQESRLTVKWGTNPAALETIHASLTPPTTTVIISGNAGVGGATLFYMDGTPKTATADSDGNYSFPVSFNWSGTVTPFAAGHSFTPASKSYAYVMADQTTVTPDYAIADVPTPVVTKLGDSNDGVCDTDCSLREAIASAEPGATVTLAPTLSGIIQIDSALGPLTLSKNIEIDGSALAVPITISGNNSAAVFTVSSGVTAILNSLTITNGKPGIDNAGGTLLVMNSTFSSNSAVLCGGGIYNGPSGKLLVTNSTFSGNSAIRGGAIYNDYSSSAVANSTFSNSASYGGAIYNDNASGTVTNSTFSGNHGVGSGIYNYASTLTVTNSTFSGNSGSGIENSNSTLTVMGSTFSGNSAGTGGGIYSAGNDSELTVTNSTFSNNSASSQGGGIYNISGSKLLITNSTFSGNSAANGGGNILNLDLGTATLRNTIVANSPTGGNCRGTIANGGNNIDDGTTCGWGSASGSMSNTNPLLGPLANNGGPTQTFGLLAGSPARDAGNDTICATAPVNGFDQRGIIRPQGVQCDIGAYELVDTIAPTVVSITLASANPTNAANVNFTVTFSKPVTGVDVSDFILTTTGDVTGASVTSVSGSGTTYTVSVNAGTGSGTIRLDVPVTATINDTAGNGPGNLPFTSGEVYEIDRTAPTVVSITLASANPTNAANVDFTVTFSESVINVGPSDFALTAPGLTNASIIGVSGSGTTYTVSVNTGTGTGTLRLDVPITATINDVAGNGLGNLPFTSGESYTIDKTAPTVTAITRASINPTNSASVDYTVTFSEAVNGVATNDFSLTTSGLSGTSITSVNGSGNSYTVTVNTGSGSGTLNLIVPVTATIYDSVGNALNSLPFTTGQVYNVRTNTFSDVPVSYWAWQYIERTYSAGITGGCSTNPLMYCPETNVTRDVMAVFLLRGKYGSTYAPPPVGSSTGFNDVPTTYWAAAWIKQLAAEGITTGCGNGNYCPGTVVTRDQIAVFLLRAKHGAAYTPPAATGTMFTDVPATYWAAAWIEQFANEGISGGCTTQGTFCPTNSLTRAQMAVFLVRTFNLP